MHTDTGQRIKPELAQPADPRMIQRRGRPGPRGLQTRTVLLTAHVDATDSTPGHRIRSHWGTERQRFVKVMPRDYKRVLEAIAEAEQNGTDVDQAIMAAAHG